MSGAREQVRTPRRSPRLGTAAAVALALTGLLVTADPADAAPPEPPNVVVVMSDDQEAASMRVMRQTERALGARGTTFRSFFATTPKCCPSRATFLTGQYSHNHGVRGETFSAQRFEQFDDSETLPVALDRSGYRTGHIGKYLNGYGDRGTDIRYVPPGWDDWRAPVRGTQHNQFDFQLNRNGDIRRYGDRRRDYQADVYARMATGFIGRASRRGRPFFLSVAPSAPHEEPVEGIRRQPRPAPRHAASFEDEPLPRPPSFNERDVSDKPSFVRRPRLDRQAVRSLRERYQDRLASLLAVDDAVHAIVKKLRRTGELGNTLVVYTSDNGYLLGEHRRTRKTLLYEESVRVPLLVRGPGFPRGARRGQVTANIDLAPTIFDVTGVEPLRPVDGVSLLPMAADPAVGDDREVLLENQVSTALRTPLYMYAEHPKGQRELYVLRRGDPSGLRADRFQERSRHAGGPHERPESAALQARLAERLAELRHCAGAGCHR